MRIVVDTNVFVSACIGRGASSDVIEACLLLHVHPFMGMELLNEYRDVISRDRLFDNARLDRKERGLLLRAFISRCQWQQVSFRWRPNLPDNADNHVLELAVAANASMIVTYNTKDFTRAELRFPQIEIAEPEVLLARLKL